MPASEATRFPDLTAIKSSKPIVWQVYLARPHPPHISPAAAELAAMLLAAPLDGR